MIEEPPKIISLFKGKETEDKPKFARMFEDQSEIDTCALLIEPDKMQRYKSFLTKYPGLKYIKSHVEFLPLKGLKL